jgi:hypothetical protein
MSVAVNDAAFDKLKSRVKTLEDARPEAKPWLEKNQTLVWLLSTTLILVSILVTFYVGVIPHLENDQNRQIEKQVGESLKDPLKSMGQMSNDVAEIKGILKGWAPFFTPQYFKKLVSLPDKQFVASLPQLKQITQLGSENKTETPVKDIADVGKRTIALSATDNSNAGVLAWEVTTALLQYRSVVNAFNPPINLASAVPTLHYQTMYAFNFEPGLPAALLASSNMVVPKSKAAQLDLIGQDKNEASATGPALLVLRDGNITLDGLHLKNVILVGVHVLYRGGPLQMSNVYFLNCTFQLTRDQNGVEFAGRVLTQASPATDLSLS